MADIIFNSTRLPLTIWFHAICLITQTKLGIPSIELGRRLGTTQTTAWKIKIKFAELMRIAGDKERLEGRIEMDDAYLGGEKCDDKTGCGGPGILQAIAEIERQTLHEPEIVWLFIGGGALYDGFRKETARLGLKSVRFEDYQPREQLSKSLSAADVHLVSLRPELEGLIVPSKFYGIAAAGRPTLFIGDADGEIARLLSRHACGITVPAGDGPALAEAVLRLSESPSEVLSMGKNARDVFERSFDLPIALRKWRDLLHQLQAGTRPHVE